MMMGTETAPPAAAAAISGASNRKANRGKIASGTGQVSSGNLKCRTNAPLSLVLQGEGSGVRGFRLRKHSPSPPAPHPGVPGRGEEDSFSLASQPMRQIRRKRQPQWLVGPQPYIIDVLRP